MIFLSIILFILYALIILLSTYGFISTKQNPYQHNEEKFSGCSIIIPVRNEEKHIINCLQSIARQDTTIPFEVIVIDDFSEDDTANLVDQFFKENAIGKLVSLSDHIQDRSSINSFKKKAIEIAIGEAKYEWIIQTDADCMVDPEWISTLYASMKKEIHFIAAPVALSSDDPSLLGRLLYWFQSLDFMTMQGITAATHYYKVGHMCNGANMAFRTSSFKIINGFDDIDGIASGDDMLLLQKMLLQYPDSSIYLKSKNAIVSTEAQPTLSSFLNQRIRWSSKAAQYKDKRLTWILGIVYLLNLWILILFIISIFKTEYLHLTLYLLACKVIIEYILIIPVASFFNKTNQIFIFPFLQPFHILYIVMAGFLGMIGKYQWKGRKVK